MSERPDHLTLSAHRDSVMARMFDAFDWASHPFGTPDKWPPQLRGAFTLLIDAAFPAAMWLGPELNLFYNDAYVPVLGPRHPDAFGRPGREIWGELWPVIGPQFAQVVKTRRGMSIENQRLIMTRHGYDEETFWDYTFSPLTDAQGNVAGVLNQASDVSEREFQARNHRGIIALDNALIAADDADTILATALRTIGETLDADRAGYGEIDASGKALDVLHCWARGDLPAVGGRHAVGQFGITEDLAAGRTVVIDDPRLDPRTSGPDVMALIEQGGIGAGVLVPVIERGRYAAEVFIHSAKSRAWRPHDVDFAETATQRLHHALVRARAENRLRDSEERYRLIFEQANDIIFTADLDQVITDANAAGARALGIPREEIIGRNIADFVNATDHAQTTAMLRQKIEQGGHTRHEVGVIRPDGRQVRWENDSTLVVDRDGFPMGLLSISRDVTEQRAFEERRELLIHELNHRVKNTLSLVQALAHQSFRGREESTVFAARLRALAGAHDLLTQEHWEGVSMAEVARGAVQAFPAGRVVIEGGPGLALQPKQAIAITMALHELATNATKYGALSNDSGRVALAWTAKHGRFRLCWDETGGPPVKVPDHNGFGLRMIERALASDLSGSVTMQFEESGLSCTIDAPLPDGGR
ncbi:PAS domain S-box protein [Sphingomonas antarctica]|uniref:PAS domain-containing sensor histidine kinase n=1 Tax=Sphingomonas antarctica TaxID=2040274 RepID=UPI0039EBB684